MKHTFTFLLPTALVAGCVSTAPISFTGTAPAQESGMFDCALRQLNQLGYTVTNAEKGAGLIVAERQTSGAVSEALTGQKSQDRLTVSIFPAADTSQTTLRVTAAGVAEKAQLFGAASKSGTAPSDHGTADAKAVIRACSPAGTGVGPGRGSGHT